MAFTVTLTGGPKDALAVNQRDAGRTVLQDAAYGQTDLDYENQVSTLGSQEMVSEVHQFIQEMTRGYGVQDVNLAGAIFTPRAIITRIHAITSGMLRDSRRVA